MSEFHVEVVRLGEVTKHPNADALSITQIHGGYPVTFRTGDYREGDLATYVPVDALVDTTRPEFAFLAGRAKERIRAKKIRGVFSMGLLVPVGKPDAKPGDDMRELLGVEKWESPADRASNGPNRTPGEKGFDPELAPSPAGPAPRVYDLEGYRRWKRELVEGEEVVITEKIHGANLRILRDDDGIHVGSRTGWKREYIASGKPEKLWWPAVRSSGLDLEALPKGVVLYGEVFGQVQDLKYGIDAGARIQFFDVLERETNRFLDYDEAAEVIQRAGGAIVPTLYRGPWSIELEALAEGKSTMADHVREGIVIRPIAERLMGRGFGDRCVLKLVGEGYLTRKDGGS